MFWYSLIHSGLVWHGFLGIDVVLCMIYLEKYNWPWARPVPFFDASNTQKYGLVWLGKVCCVLVQFATKWFGLAWVSRD